MEYLTFMPLIAGCLTWAILKHKTIGGNTGIFAVVLSSVLHSVVLAARGFTWISIVQTVTWSTILYLSSLLCSTLTYRLSPFHPLARFPGPLPHKLSSLWIAAIVYTGQRYRRIESLHQMFGPIVRIGPNMLSINSRSAVYPIYAAANGMDKSSAYILGSEPGKGLFFMQTKKEHDQRRKVWAPAFTNLSLRAYEPALIRRTSELSSCIINRADDRGVVDMYKCFTHWAYDFMGEIVFGGSNELELMRDGDPMGLVRSGQQATVMFETLGEVPWLFQITWPLPLMKEVHKVGQIARRMLSRRIQVGDNASIDIFHHLLRANLPEKDLKVETMFGIQAGFDTSSSVSTLLFFHLIRNQSAYRRLQAEVDLFFDETGAEDLAALRELNYLNAVVEEGLRLGSPFSSHPRVVPNPGTYLAGAFIPGGTVVSVPAWAQNVSPENFYPSPEEFIPERWLEGGLGPTSRCSRGAVMSFSFGSFGCPGKALAYHEMRVLTARLVHEFDMSFPPEFDPDLFLAGVQNMRTTIFTKPFLVCAKHRRRARDG